MNSLGDCSVCLKPVPSDGKFMTCGACKSLYHLGSCAGIKESTFGAMGQERREKWRCRSCRSADSSSTQGSVSEEPQGICASEELLSAVNTKLDLLVSLKANVDTLLTLPSKVDELLTLKPAVQCLQETVKTLQQSIGDLTLKYDSVLAKATENEKNTEALQVRLAEVCSVADEQSRTIQRLQGDLNHLEQRSRSTNLEIHGLPCHKDENLERIIADLGDKLDLPPLQAGDVLAIHRLATKPGPAPPVLIRFASVKVYDEWMSRRVRLSSLYNSGKLPKVYFNENLTRANRELFWMARSKAKEVLFKYVWVKGGKIFAKKEQGSALVRVNTINDLENIS
ncbi:uncharacterized protein LOC121834753 [Ixodes scapularis]|uniref:uncharacterized protein LOC121834753 n=1 Tax=Ixodes scapularis TaxID=6945 RepID=UPI001C3887DB|nr:uncharacterized protein LOC121834753 [Ixodes scapularis]